MLWPTAAPPSAVVHAPQTGVETETLQELARASVTVPDNFEIHSRLKRHVKHRLESANKGEGIDWAAAEVSSPGQYLFVSQHSRRAFGCY
jgi:probable 2-oxoglutarate dehydrogenase E1 component DHKTD1